MRNSKLIRSNDSQPSYKRTTEKFTSHSKRIILKWNAIKYDFIQRYPELKEETLALNKKNYNKILERIGKLTNRSANDVRMEILNW